MKFEIKHEKGLICKPTQQEEQLKEQVLLLINNNQANDMPKMLKEVEELLRFKRMNNSHLAYMAGSPLQILVKRVFKQVTIFKVCASTGSETDKQ